MIGETLRRVTPQPPDDPEARNAFHRELRARIEREDFRAAGDPKTLASPPLSAWIEADLGLRSEDDGGTARLVRVRPMPLSGEKGAAALLARDTGRSLEVSESATRRTLLAGHRSLDEEIDARIRQLDDKPAERTPAWIQGYFRDAILSLLQDNRTFGSQLAGVKSQGLIAAWDALDFANLRSRPRSGKQSGGKA